MHLEADSGRTRHDSSHVTLMKHLADTVESMYELTRTEAIDLVGRYEAGQEIPEQMRADVRLLGRAVPCVREDGKKGWWPGSWAPLSGASLGRSRDPSGRGSP